MTADMCSAWLMMKRGFRVLWTSPAHSHAIVFGDLDQAHDAIGHSLHPFTAVSKETAASRLAAVTVHFLLMPCLPPSGVPV
jgi:hypothetical protein